MSRPGKIAPVRLPFGKSASERFSRPANDRWSDHSEHLSGRNDDPAIVKASRSSHSQLAPHEHSRIERSGMGNQTLSSHILILADTGGSNGAQRGAWKQEIQRQLCDGLGLYVTLCHYPSGASKWNPIEHRLFSHISRN